MRGESKGARGRDEGREGAGRGGRGRGQGAGRDAGCGTSMSSLNRFNFSAVPFLKRGAVLLMSSDAAFKAPELRISGISLTSAMSLSATRAWLGFQAAPMSCVASATCGDDAEPWSKGAGLCARVCGDGVCVCEREREDGGRVCVCACVVVGEGRARRRGDG